MAKAKTRKVTRKTLSVAKNRCATAKKGTQVCRTKSGSVTAGATKKPIKRGRCKVVNKTLRVCVNKKGVISVGPAKSRGSAGTKRRKKSGSRKGTACATPAFKMKSKAGVRCACGVKTKSGGLMPRYLKMSSAKCKAGIPMMSWSAAKRKADLKKGTPFSKAKW